MVAGDVPSEDWLEMSAWMASCFRSVDIGIGSLTGYYMGGELVLDLRAIAKAYTSTWFLPDFAIVLCDWMSLATSAGLSGGDVDKLASGRWPILC